METSADTKPATEKNKGGRPPNSMNVMSRAAREAARATGRLPHEILLDIARGNPQTLKMPEADGTVKEKLVGVTLDQMQDAAKSAAPYFAPKLSTVETIAGVSDDDLDAIIAGAASEAGVGVSFVGEGAPSADETPARGGGRRRATVNW